MQLDRVPYAILLGLGLAGCSDRSLDDEDGATDDGSFGTTDDGSSGATDTETDDGNTGPCLGAPWTDTGPCLQPPWTETWTDTDTSVTNTTEWTGPCLGQTEPCLDVTDTWTDTDTSGTDTTGWTGPCLAPPTDGWTDTSTASICLSLRDGFPADAPLARRAVHIAAAEDVLDRILQGDILPADVAERLQRKRSLKG